MEKIMIVWIVLAIAFAVLEAVTANLVSIWFTIGAVGALAAYFLNASYTVQIVVFVAVSVIALFLTRPLVKKFSKPKIQPTNADMLLGKEAVVTEGINNTHATGAVKIKGTVWTARSSDDSEIPEGEIVIVKAIEGVKLIVERKPC